ncbi:MAG: malate synthase A [Dehalococcoidia bacterium]|nr:malate synthase A [Dehalococcoidia bacterium]
MRAGDARIQLLGGVNAEVAEILTPEALAFVADLAREFEPRRRSLMQARAERQAQLDAGNLPDFLPDTTSIRSGKWRVAPSPKDLQNRRVEITGPSSNRRMVINALNSGAQVYMTDFEDAHSPGWSKTVEGQVNVRDAAAGTISYQSPEGRQYRLEGKTATLVVRPRGLHLLERHLLVDGQPIAASFFDFGLTFFHNARTLLERGSGPYFYLPKLQGHEEARLWKEVFSFAEKRLGIPQGSVRATVLIEHILAAFEMEEILYELRDNITALNLGRWDYIFSFIKTFSAHPEFVLPDRSQVSMTTHFLRSVAELLVQTCHRRGAHALGGMSTYIPRRDDPASNEKALAQVRADKEREAAQGFDGAWVAHPGLVPVVQEVFDRVLPGDNQLSRIPEVRVTGKDLLNVPKGDITEAGLRNNVSVALQYIDAWIQREGAVAIFGLMEDTATAEIARSQIWQWAHHNAHLADGQRVSKEMYLGLRMEEVAKLIKGRTSATIGALDKAVELLDDLVDNKTFTEFLTIPGYRYLD